MPGRLDGLDPSPYGVNSHSSPADLVEKFAGIGVAWHRADVDWDAIEPDEGQYRWDDMDALVWSTAPRYGLSLLTVVAYTPRWASTDGRRTSPPRQPQLFSRFVAAFLDRYRDGIHALSLWNEPDLRQFWTGSPDEYCRLVVPALEEARRMAPELVLAGPDLSGWSKGAQRDWLDPILKQTDGAAGGPLFDVITHHQYGGGDTVAGRVKEIEKLRSFLDGRANTSRPLWITEIGWNDGPEGQVSSLQQAENLRGVMRAMKDRPWWQKTFWYDSHGRVDGKPRAEWGLLGPDGSPERGREKPAFRAYAEVTGTVAAPPTPATDTEALRRLTALYRGLLGREPDTSAIAAYLGEIRRGETVAVCSALTSSAEFRGRGEGAAALVEQLYRGVLGRDADPAGHAQALAAINASRTAEWVAGMLESEEFRQSRA
jgi:hypothetical protein